MTVNEAIRRLNGLDTDAETKEAIALASDALEIYGRLLILDTQTDECNITYIKPSMVGKECITVNLDDFLGGAL